MSGGGLFVFILLLVLALLLVGRIVYANWERRAPKKDTGRKREFGRRYSRSPSPEPMMDTAAVNIVNSRPYLAAKRERKISPGWWEEKPESKQSQKKPTTNGAAPKDMYTIIKEKQQKTRMSPVPPVEEHTNQKWTWEGVRTERGFHFSPVPVQVVEKESGFIFKHVKVTEEQLSVPARERIKRVVRGHDNNNQQKQFQNKGRKNQKKQ